MVESMNQWALTGIAAASPPDVRYLLADRAPILNLIPSTPALPPDVRRGFASPLEFTEVGLSPWFGLWPISIWAKPEPGAQPIGNLKMNGEA